MTANENHWPYKVGEEVFVNGHGAGRVKLLHESRWPSEDYVTVEIKYPHKCSCGNLHTAVETITIHPQHVLYTEYQKQKLREGK
jgi:hypothetical protein